MLLELERKYAAGIAEHLASRDRAIAHVQARHAAEMEATVTATTAAAGAATAAAADPRIVQRVLARHMEVTRSDPPCTMAPSVPPIHALTMSRSRALLSARVSHADPTCAAVHRRLPTWRAVGSKRSASSRPPSGRPTASLS